MAWNPTPEVQVARDAAKALTKAGRFIDRIVLLFTTLPAGLPIVGRFST